jgi:Fe-S-cluster containining protein
MEFTLDLQLLRGILNHEIALVRAEVPRNGVLGALEASQRRHDERLASAVDAQSLACREGCAWCCHFSVDVRAYEVFRILDFVEATFTPAAKTRLAAAVDTNGRVFQALDEEARATLNLPCPFLAESTCSIYPARPQSCRNYHATDASGCKASYDHPYDMDIDPDFAPGVYQVGAAHVEGVSAALQAAGYDTNAYELNSALAAALADPGSRLRFEAKHPPFGSLVGEAVIAEFDDLLP